MLASLLKREIKEPVITKNYDDILNYNNFILDKYTKSKYNDLLENKKIKMLLGIIKRRIPDEKKYFKRLMKEFKLILLFDFENVFYQVNEILELVGDVPHIIRGSAGSCLYCYLLAITDIDPIKENIALSRFMHKTRKSIPDIDIDFPSHLRDKIYQKIFINWENNVARISNHIKFKESSAYREAIRMMGYRKFVPKNYELSDIFQKQSDRDKVHKLANDLIGKFRCYSLHCGGIVIFPSKVPDDYYLQDFEIINGQMGKQIKLDKDEVENEDLIKIDILSNRGLSQLLCISDRKLIDYPHDDAVFKMLSFGENIGLTHSESRAMMKVFRTMKPKNIKEIAVGLALIRPAAAKNNQKSDFLKDYDIYKYERNNYIIFDDDATRFIKKILRCDESTADNYRRAFSKGKLKEISEFKRKYYKIEKNLEVRKIIIERLEQLHYYSFCKSHAYSYANLVYALAYQKLHNSKEFWLSTLNNCNSSYRKWVHYRQAVNIGIELCCGKKPYKLNGNKLISYKKEKQYYSNPVDQYFNYGYWIGKQFLPGMYYNEYWKERTNKHKNLEKVISKDNDLLYCNFKGLIATGRGCKKNNGKGYITFVTIGVDNNTFIDLVLYGYHKISNMAVLKGFGKVKYDGYCKYIEVSKFESCYIK